MENINVYILSDSIGETAEQNARASLAQFDGLEYSLRKFSHIRSVPILENVFSEISNENQKIIFISLVDPVLKQKTIDICNDEKYRYIDILSPSINAISSITGLTPSTRPGALRRLDENYFKRVEAIEFAVRYDDGKNPKGILESDITIVGISRTSKTPLSMYLANKNLKVANIPLVPETNPPAELFQIPSKKIIGLTNSPENLYQIRKERLRALGLPFGSSYSDLDRILSEVEYAHDIMKKLGCPIIDVANKAIEETADIILSYIKKANSAII